MGTRFAQRSKIPPSSFLLLLALLFTLPIAIGCDRPDTRGPETTTPDSARPSDADPVLPDAPWFEIPDDWNESHPVVSPNAKHDAHFISLAEKEMPLVEADGQGRAWIESVSPIDPTSTEPTWQRGDGSRLPPSAPASASRRIQLAFEVGEMGIDEGGLIFVMPDPFWSWSEAQTRYSEAPGFTTAVPLAEGVRLAPGDRGAEFLTKGRALEAGERIEIVLGAGPRGARVDEFAEHGSEILIAVDANGDGTRRWISDSAHMDIVAREGVRLVAFGPAEVAPGESVEISIAIVDANANRALWPDSSRDDAGRSKARFEIERVDGGSLEELGLDEDVQSLSQEAAPHRIRLNAPAREGTLRLSIRGRDALDGLTADVNPIVVRRSNRRLVWGDLHGHSRWSDGTGTPDDYFGYARDVARLDVIALTDHDHWGVRPLDDHPELAKQILETALRYHDPGRFVTIPGYEWTNWLHGHRHVLYFDGTAPIFSAIDPATDRPDELWDALRGRDALTFAHHSAGEPVATNWFYPPDPELEPLTEISSVHGMSEAADAPVPIRGGIPGYFVRDVLQVGYRLGFVGSGDSHDGHPGLAHLTTGQAGLAGIYTESLDRKSLLAAMKARRTFATNGIRPWLEVSIDETPMGGTLEASDADQTLRIRYEATRPIERIDLIRSGSVARIEGGDAMRLDITRTIPPLRPGDFHYVRIVERDDGVAWSSPIFVDGAGSAAD